MRAQLIPWRQVKPGEHNNLVTRTQVPRAVGDLLIETDPRRRSALPLVRRIVEDPQGRLHPPDRHQAVVRLHNDSLLPGARSQVKSTADGRHLRDVTGGEDSSG